MSGLSTVNSVGDATSQMSNMIIIVGNIMKSKRSCRVERELISTEESRCLF